MGYPPFLWLRRYAVTDDVQPRVRSNGGARSSGATSGSARGCHPPPPMHPHRSLVQVRVRVLQRLRGDPQDSVERPVHLQHKEHGGADRAAGGGLQADGGSIAFPKKGKGAPGKPTTEGSRAAAMPAAAAFVDDLRATI